MGQFQPDAGDPMLPRIAVLLAAYNGLRWLPQQLDSILNQEDVSPTVFVSVDRSSDGTERWLSSLTEGDPRVVCLPFGQTFGGAAANFYRLFRDVDVSDFDFVALADQDDIWMSGKLARAVASLQGGHADAYSSNVLAFWPTNEVRLLRKAQPQRKWDYLFEAAGPGCTYVVKTAVIEQFQDLLGRRWEHARQICLHDWFLYAFVRSSGYRWVIDECPGVLYRQHEHNQVGANKGLGAFLRRLEKVRSGWAIDQAAKIAEVVGVDSEPFVENWLRSGRMDYLRLAMHANQCRRRVYDQILFFLSCVLLSMRGRPR